MAGRTGRHPTETRSRTLDAVDSLFVEHGLEATSMRMITTRTRVRLALTDSS